MIYSGSCHSPKMQNQNDKLNLNWMISIICSSAYKLLLFVSRAAFMCGREPNFELPEEEKQELMKFKWDEFLAVTRHSINNKSWFSLLSCLSFLRPLCIIDL